MTDEELIRNTLKNTAANGQYAEWVCRKCHGFGGCRNYPHLAVIVIDKCVDCYDEELEEIIKRAQQERQDSEFWK